MNAILSDWLSGRMNYTYSKTENTIDDQTTLDKAMPRNIVNAALNAKFKNGISAYLGANWVDSTVYYYENLVTAYSANINLKPYMLVNARIGYMFMKNTTEVSLSAFDLFDQAVYKGLPGS